jgi:ribosome-binding factor A
MTKGYVDSGVEIQGVKVTQDKNDTHIYHSVTTVLPKKTGAHRMCLQSLNAAKLVFMNI